MVDRITEQIRILSDDFKRGVYSVKEFQFRLEPLLGSYRVVSKETEEEFRRFVNDLEVILYTIPEDQQRDQAARVADAVIDLIEKEGL